MSLPSSAHPVMDPSEVWVRISDLKQYTYCRRIPFYFYVTPVPRNTSYKMEYGKRQHDVLEQLEKRRTLQQYGLEKGERLFHQYLACQELRVSGRLDLLLRVDTELIPVEFKYSERTNLNHKYQLAGYALLLQALREGHCERGLVYLIPRDEIIEYSLSNNVLNYARRLLAGLRRDIATQRFPEPTRHTGRCRECEFQQYCNDVEWERE